MLTPDYLDTLPDALVELWQQVEEDILRDIARRIAKMNSVTDTAGWQLWRFEQIQALHQDVAALLAKYSGKTDAELRRLLLEAGRQTLASDDELYRSLGFSPSSIETSEQLNNLLNAGYRQTLGSWRNLTATTAHTVTQEFERALDRAWLQISSGAFDYKTAIKRAVDGLAQRMAGVTYPSGHRDTLEVAVRRAALTGVNQTAAQLQLARADEMGCDFVEVTAHGGARPQHAVWQGKVYHRGGAVIYDGVRYEDFEIATGYGTGPGLCGWNCRHNFYPFFPGLSEPNWGQGQLEALNAKEVEYGGHMYSRYEISQMQRQLERRVRKAKRRYLAEDAAGLDATQAAVQLKAARQKLAAFVRDTGGRADSQRTGVAGFGRSAASKATAAAERNHRLWLKSIGAEKTSLNTLAKYYDGKYNNSPAYRMLTRYAQSVESGMLSPLSGLDLYSTLYERIEQEIIGQETANGIRIRAQSQHFMERVLGTMKDPHTGYSRSGVPIEDIIDCVLHGTARPVRNSEKSSSQLFCTEKCAVSINPKTGVLIQCNPL